MTTTENNSNQTPHFLNALFATEERGIALLDSEMRILKTNKSFCRFFDFSPEEMTERFLSDFEYVPSQPSKERRTLPRDYTTAFGKTYLTRQTEVIYLRILMQSIEVATPEKEKQFLLFAEKTRKPKRTLKKYRGFSPNSFDSVLFKNFCDGILLISSDFLQIYDTNLRIEQLLGFSKAEFQAMPFFDLIPTDDREKTIVFLQKINFDEFSTPVKREMQHQTKEGKTLDTCMTIVPIQYKNREALVVSIRDISERKNFQRQIQEIQNFQMAVLKSLPDLTFVIHKDGTFLDFYASTLAASDLTRPKEAFLGKKIQDIFFSEVAKQTLLLVQLSIESGQIQQFSFDLKSSDGREVRHFESKINAIDDEKAIVAIRNWTDLKRTQDDLKIAYQALERKNEELKKYIESNLELENFAYIASHDLREPLRNIVSFTQLLGRRYGHLFDKQAEEYMGIIVHAAKNMNFFIEDLLEYSQVNKMIGSIDVFDLNVLIKSVVADLEMEIQSAQATIFWDNLPTHFEANYLKIHILFKNLIQNAIQFRRPDVPPVVKITAQKQRNQWFLSVSDNGIGIEKQYFQKIFLMFKKLTSKHLTEGSGMGLAICRRIVEKHEGEIWVESTISQGSTFYFTIKTDLLNG